MGISDPINPRSPQYELARIARDVEMLKREKNPATGGGGGGAWAMVYRSTNYTLANATNTSLPWTHFQTSDTTIFTSGPSGVTGDEQLFLNAAGVYTAELGLVFASGFPTSSTAYISFFPLNHGPNYNASKTETGVGVAALHDSRVYPLGVSEVPVYISVLAYQNSGGNQTISSFYMRVSFTPTADFTSVY